MANYRIRIKGHLDRRHAGALGDLRITHLPNGETLLSGPVTDQAALFGLLIDIRDLGLPLLAVDQVTCDASEQE